ncbi:MAG: aminodeoxychorismate/anthranilate synthase component II [Verrucomicrobiota bacterium]
MILIIDNYDSFTFNLHQYFLQLGEATLVARNDELDTGKVQKLNPEMIVISPGPGRPRSTGRCLEIIETFKERIPILGICLGMQTIARYFGAKVVEAMAPMHGKVREIRNDGKGMFSGLNQSLKVTRYHSLVVERASLPDCLEISAESEEGEIMGLRHRQWALEGVQFHPEAILTEEGLGMLENAVKTYC